MPPLEDELRAALHGRAATLPPPADPFAGVERRARGLRRRRAAASVAGTALAVLAVVGAVPLLTPDRAPAPTPGEIATAPPAIDRDALDPSEPWVYRGESLGTGFVDTLSREVAARHGDPRDEGRVIALFGQTWEPSGRKEAVFVSQRTGGGATWGVAQESEAGLEVVQEQELAAGTRALVARLAGDEADRVLVVAAPSVDVVQYADREGPLGRAGFAPLARGVATGPAPSAAAQVEVVGSSGEREVFRAPVPGPATPAADAPANVLGWAARGTSLRGPDVLQARRAYAATRASGPEGVLEEVLLAGDDDAGRRYLLGQFWLPGDAVADTFAVVLAADGTVQEPQLLRALAPDADVAAMFLSPVNEQSRGELVVVPRPGTGQVLYAADDASEWVPKDVPGLDGVVLLERSPDAERGVAVDRVRLLDGDGRTITTGTVVDLLCGKTSCG